MRKKYVIGNWKTNPKTKDEALALARAITKIAIKRRGITFGAAVPSVFLPSVSAILSKKALAGVQDISDEKAGPHTGEFSAAQARSAGAFFSIIGHSERRAKGENEEVISKKLILAVSSGLMAVLCVGEKKRDHEGKFLSELKHSVLESLRGFPKKKLRALIIAYEPVWAVGEKAKSSATPHEAFEAITAIRRTLADCFGKNASAVPILYGGSVDEKNAASFISEGGANGLLVGRQSLDPGAMARLSVSL